VDWLSPSNTGSASTGSSLRRFPGTNRARAQMLLEEGRALVNGTSTLMMNKGQEQ